PRSTRTPRSASSGPWTGSPAAAPRWPSPTGCPPPRQPTRSWSSTPGGSSSAARTPGWPPNRASTPTCTPPGCAAPPDPPAPRRERRGGGASALAGGPPVRGEDLRDQRLGQQRDVGVGVAEVAHHLGGALHRPPHRHEPPAQLQQVLGEPVVVV